MKLDTILKHMNRIKLNGDGIKAVEVSRNERCIVMDGAAFYRQFPDHETEPHCQSQRYVMRQGVRICTYEPDLDSDEADTRQEVTP